MTLIVVLNAVLSVLIVAVIVALHTRAILADRRDRPGPATVAAHPRPVRPITPASRYHPTPVSATTTERREPAAA